MSRSDDQVQPDPASDQPTAASTETEEEVGADPAFIAGTGAGAGAHAGHPEPEDDEQ